MPTARIDRLPQNSRTFLLPWWAEARRTALQRVGRTVRRAVFLLSTWALTASAVPGTGMQAGIQEPTQQLSPAPTATAYPYGQRRVVPVREPMQLSKT